MAEYITEQLDETAFSTAVQIGRKVEVSETTVIRLAYALGFNSFSEMQEKIKRQILNNNNTQFSARRENNIPDVDDHFSPFSKVIRNNIRILNQTLHQLNEEDMWNVVDALIHADRILIVGFEESYAAAYWFSFMLSKLRGNVDLCPQTGDNYEKLIDLTEKSVVFVLSFPRYVKETPYIAEYAKIQGITLISVTDRILSPAGRISDIILITEENVESESISMVLSLLDLIIMGINMKDQARIQARRKKLEQLYSTWIRKVTYSKTEKSLSYQGLSVTKSC